MKIFCIAFVLLALPATNAYSKKKQVPKLYVFGFSSSFSDSTVYFTNVQELDGAWVDERTTFLSNREEYTYQLKEYFTTRQNPNLTCVVIYAHDRKSIDKKYAKLKNRYTNQKKKHFNVEYIDESKFNFHSVKPDLADITDNSTIIREEKKVTKKEKANKNKRLPIEKSSEGDMPTSPK